jgi:hypothetical protein
LHSAIDLPPGAVSGFDFILGDSFLKNVYTSFDYGDWTPENRTADVPFVQMLAITNITDAFTEFTAVRGQEINVEKQESAQSTAARSGAVVVTDALKGMDLINKRLYYKHNDAHDVVATTSTCIRGWLAHVKHRFRKCMTQLVDAFGLVAVALLAGTFTLVLLIFIVAVSLGTRNLVWWRRECVAYGIVDEASKDTREILFDAQYGSYNYHTTSQYVSITNSRSHHLG